MKKFGSDSSIKIEAMNSAEVTMVVGGATCTVYEDLNCSREIASMQANNENECKSAAVSKYAASYWFEGKCANLNVQFQ